MNPLDIRTGNELLNSILPETHFTISELLGEGLHILGGSPKNGKSWLVLWWGLQIAKGEPIWQFETRRGTVLYLALEDSFARLQDRLLSMTEESPDDLKLAVKSGSLSAGLQEQIEVFCNENPNTRLIVIDTLQKVRTQNESANQYAQDYKDMDVLKELAFRFNTSILLVHHLRKMEASDPIDMLSGSTGLSGEVDSIFLLKKSNRFEQAATLSCTGRDIKSRTIELTFDDETCLWNAPAEQELIPLIDPTIQVVVDFLSSTHAQMFSGSATQLSEALFAHTGTRFATTTLSTTLLRHTGQLEHLGYQCNLSRTKSGRKITLEQLSGERAESCPIQ